MRLTILLLCGWSCFAQEFEAASIKANKSGSGRSSSHSSNGQLVAINLSLRDYVRMAFDVRDYQITAPDWMASERFDIVAKIPPHEGPSLEGQRMQKLLAERFGLKVHHESKEAPVYGLVLAKGGSKMKLVPDEKGSSSNSTGRHLAGTMDMARLAEFLSGRMDRPVVNQTKLEGVYEVTLDWSPDGVVDDTKPDLLGALQDQLGLKLTKDKAPVDMIVVDRVEKTPTEN